MAKVNTLTANLHAGPRRSDGVPAGTKQHYDEPPRVPAEALHQASEAMGVVGQTHGNG